MTADHDITILTHLLGCGDGYVSGNAIAQALGISRVGVWARLEKLRSEGFSFDAIRHKGYKLIGDPTVFNEKLTRALLVHKNCKCGLYAFDSVNSTNSIASALLAEQAQTPFAVIATEQTAGRGRLGRRWHSPSDGNLYISFGFRPNLSPHKMQTITLWMGLKICAFLNEKHQLPVKLKWPNDLLLNGKKIAGMLTEARVDADRTHDLTLGIGLNVNSDCKCWPAEVSAIATSMVSHGSRLAISRLAADLVETVINSYKPFIDDNYQLEMRDLWHSYDVLQNQAIEANYKGKPIIGHTLGINETGSLLLRLEDDSIVAVHSGEISIGSRNLKQ
jgi:BirA family biotin operon repressor/biotin-[acetyl-CoA-carboxylase] ligase